MTPAHAEQLYEDGFFAWTQLQAKKLRRFARSRPNLPLDLAHLAEEIADLGIERRKRLRSWTRRIIEHLLLLERSPAQDPRRGWSRRTSMSSGSPKSCRSCKAASGSTPRRRSCA